MRYDPDGNEKRRARKGEQRCGECGAYQCPLRRVLHPTERANCMRKGQPCRADDYAGACAHFVAMNPRCQCYYTRPFPGEDFRRRCMETASNTACCDTFSDGPHVISVCKTHANMLRRRKGPWKVGPIVADGETHTSAAMEE